MMKIIGRKLEQERLKKSLISGTPELIAVYGRRRVGKTFLIREFYHKNLVFEVTGLHKGSMNDQLENFTKALSTKTANTHQGSPRNWFEAFTLLEHHLNTLKSVKRKVIFIDEFPWIATSKSKFLMAFEHFWNSYCTKRKDLIVVICGSAASYMVQKIIRNTGGLHNRITQKLRLLPFNLKETQQFLKSNQIIYTEYDTLQIYMAIGGVPHYLNGLQKGLSVAQNIDALCFEKDGILNDEFNQLYSSLFNDSEKHLILIKTLAKCTTGIPRNKLIEKSGIQSGGDFSIKLDELIESGFVSEYSYFQNQAQLTLYRLSDEYSKFYLKFIEKNKHGGMGTWQRMFTRQSYKSWSGFTFETLCLKHIRQIKKALGLEAIYSTNSSWFNENAQIDLLIDRDDHIINLCEMKFHNAPFTIDKKYYARLKNKMSEFQLSSETQKTCFLTMITTYGIRTNQYSNELVQNSINMGCFFQDE